MSLLHAGPYRLPDIDRPYGFINCQDAVNFAKAHDLWITSGFSPGDILLYCEDGSGTAGHTGICESDGATSATAIEGNTSPTDAGSQTNGGGVYRKVRPHGPFILGAISIAKLAKFMGWVDNPTVIAAAVLKVARSQIGYVEHGGAGNDSGNLTKYWRQTDPSLEGSSWCADFVSWCFEKAARAKLGGLSASTRSALAKVTNAAKARKGALSTSAKARVTSAIKALKAMRAK